METATSREVIEPTATMEQIAEAERHVFADMHPHAWQWFIPWRVRTESGPRFVIRDIRTYLRGDLEIPVQVCAWGWKNSDFAHNVLAYLAEIGAVTDRAVIQFIQASETLN